MIKEKKEMIWRAFGPVWVQKFWKEINNLYKDGWCVCENVGNMIADAPILRPNFVKVVFERDSVALTLEHLKTITAIEDYKELCENCGFDYDKKLTKTPMKFKKFIRESLEAMLNPVSEKDLAEMLAKNKEVKNIAKPIIVEQLLEEQEPKAVIEKEKEVGDANE